MGLKTFPRHLYIVYYWFRFRTKFQIENSRYHQKNIKNSPKGGEGLEYVCKAQYTRPGRGTRSRPIIETKATWQLDN